MEGYLSDVLSAGARGSIVGGGETAYDAVAVHPYRQDPMTGIAAVRRIHEWLSRSHMYDTHIWPNEVGWAVDDQDLRTPDQGPYTGSEARQDQYLKTFMQAMNDNKQSWNIGPVTWFCYRDSRPVINSFSNMGLRRADANQSMRGSFKSLSGFGYESRPGPLPGYRLTA